MSEPDPITLADVLATRPLLPAPLAADVIGSLLGRLEPLHARGEIQHSLAPRAIGIHRYDDDLYMVHDLGPRHLPTHPPGTYIRDGLVELDLRYVSPELIRKKPLGPPHDLFVVGIFLFELVTGFHPFDADSDLARMEAIVTGRFDHATSSTSSPVLALAERLLAPDPRDRIGSIAELRTALSWAVGEHERIADELRGFLEPELRAGDRSRDELVEWAADHFTDVPRKSLKGMHDRMELPGFLEVMAGQIVDERIAQHGPRSVGPLPEHVVALEATARRLAAPQVRAGLRSRDDLVEWIDSMLWDTGVREVEPFEPRDDGERIVRELCERVVDALIATYAAPSDGDNARLDRAFAELERRGIVARQAIGWTWREGLEMVLAEEVPAARRAGLDVRGYAFFHEYVIESAIADRALEIGVGARAGDPAESAAIGREVVEVLKSAGLPASWSGDRADPIVVEPFTWHAPVPKRSRTLS